MIYICYINVFAQFQTNEPECGRTPLQSRIFGGSAVGIDEYPWAARLIYVDCNKYRLFFLE